MIDPHNQQPALRVRPGPEHQNLNGSTFGGWALCQFDIAASIAAWQVARGPTATRAIKDLVFIKPIFTYDIVSFYNEVIAVGTTSITIRTEAYAQRTNGLTSDHAEDMVKVAEAILVFVAINKPGEKRTIKS